MKMIVGMIAKLEIINQNVVKLASSEDDGVIMMGCGVVKMRVQGKCRAVKLRM